MTLHLQESLCALVRNKYNAAKAAGALTFAESHLAHISVGGVRFQLRYCPSLAKKPSKSNEGSSTSKKPIDPFLNPDPQLFVTNAPNTTSASHIIVLNKFPIIQNHFILATSSDALKQDQLLAEEDLQRTFECLRQWNGTQESGSSDGKRLFAFFNSGDHSGASQPHRHIQFLPVEDMHGDEGGKGNWQLLLDEIILSPKTKFSSYEFHVNRSLPFVHFGLKLPTDCDSRTLYTAYMDLMKAAIASVRHFRQSRPENLALHPSDGQTCSISYNLGMSTAGMVICARRSEGQNIERADGTVIDTVALNGTLLGGTLMVKNQESFELLRQNGDMLSGILRGVAIPSGSGYEEFNQSDLAEDTKTFEIHIVKHLANTQPG